MAEIYSDKVNNAELEYPSRSSYNESSNFDSLVPGAKGQPGEHDNLAQQVHQVPEYNQGLKEKKIEDQ